MDPIRAFASSPNHAFMIHSAFEVRTPKNKTKKKEHYYTVWEFPIQQVFSKRKHKQTLYHFYST